MKQTNKIKVEFLRKATRAKKIKKAKSISYRE